MNKGIRTFINGYLICNMIWVAIGVIDMRLMNFQTSLSDNIRSFVRLPASLLYIYYLLDLAGVHIAILIVVTIFNIKDFMKTKDKRMLAVSSFLVICSFVISVYFGYKFSL